jgi:hypothetical protein
MILYQWQWQKCLLMLMIHLLFTYNFKSFSPCMLRISDVLSMSSPFLQWGHAKKKNAPCKIIMKTMLILKRWYLINIFPEFHPNYQFPLKDALLQFQNMMNIKVKTKRNSNSYIVIQRRKSNQRGTLLEKYPLSQIFSLHSHTHGIQTYYPICSVLAKWALTKLP